MRTRKKLSAITLLIVLSISVFTTPLACAQTLDQKTLAAVSAAINLLLLDSREKPIDRPSGASVLLDINEKSPDTYTVNTNLFAEFQLQDEGVELCFIIESANDVEAGDLSVEVNGRAVNVVLGENCFRLYESQQRTVNYINLIVNTPGVSVNLSTLELAASNQTQLTLPRLTRGGWDEAAVRKVLKIFAFGGHATDAQIMLWANMYPSVAIQEMLNFDEHNLKLSPLAPNERYNQTQTQYGTLFDFVNFISDQESDIPIPTKNRESLGIDSYNFDDAFNRMITIRGLNPFRQKIGFWETNYHLATNLDASVSRRQMAAYYDLIMQAHESGVPYHKVLGVAAKSAAVAEQYGHDRNEWVYDRRQDKYICECNEDFAREIHQLFYGIFGVDDPQHETLTIPETAKLLTDMPLDDSNGPLDDIAVVFGTQNHHVAAVNVLGQSIAGADASEKIDNLMPISIQHPESLKNLPVMIISVLADDNLSEGTKNRLRAAWASMGADKYFLDFIHAYAISTLFHSPAQFKYLTSHERALYMANKNNLENLEAFFGGANYSGRAGRSVGGVISDDNAGDFFRPLHNVFGGQTSLEAADSALVFANNFNRLTDDEYALRESVQCDTCDQGDSWEKRWHEVLPQRADGNFYVADVAQWLWNHAVGNLNNYTELEKAHLYSLLGAVRYRPSHSGHQNRYFDFNLLMCVVEDYQNKVTTPDLTLNNIMSNSIYYNYCQPDDDGVDGYSEIEKAALNRAYSGQQILQNPLIQNLMNQMGNATLPLNASGQSNSSNVRERARERVSNALGFIFTTPFIFAEGQ